jgi:hypothetical protein
VKDAACISLHKCMPLVTASDSLYGMLCISEGLDVNLFLERWIPREPALSEEWWNVMAAFLNLYEYLMTDRFRWETPVQGGGAGRQLQRLRDARPTSITQERQMGADLMAADQMMLQLNTQRRHPPMMPEGKAAQHRGRFSTYIKGILGPTDYQIVKWVKHNTWRTKAVEPAETVRIPALAPIEEEIEIPPPAPIDFVPIVPAAAAEPGAEAAAGAEGAAGAEEADAQANARANAQANARAGGAAEAELQPEEPGAQQEPLEPHAEPEEEEEELLWTRIRTGLNRLRRSMGGLSSGDEEWEPEAQHEPEEPEEPQVEPEAQQEPQIEAEAPAGPEGRPGAEPEQQVPQPEPEAEAGAAAGSTRGTRQKPQPKAAGKTSKVTARPQVPPSSGANS